MFDIGAPELILILVIVLVLFGGKKLPELSKSIGEAIRELRKGLQGPLDDNHKDEKKTQEKSNT
ncbi:twin-arginine translocase TatA/TatE family subunit [soil metagenome]